MKKQNKKQKKLPLERKLVRRLIDLRKSELDQAAGGGDFPTMCRRR